MLALDGEYATSEGLDHFSAGHVPSIRLTSSSQCKHFHNKGGYYNIPSNFTYELFHFFCTVLNPVTFTSSEETHSALGGVYSQHILRNKLSGQKDLVYQNHTQSKLTAL